MSALRFFPATLLIMNACSRDYAPDYRASGEQIYQTACIECHKPAMNGSIFILQPNKANIVYITDKIRSGSLLMPSFPKMQAENLRKISHYVLDHTDIEEE